MKVIIGTLFVSFCLIGIVMSQTTTPDGLMRPCKADDFLATYTNCLSGTRNLIYYVREGVNCTGGTHLPSNKYRLPCPIRCDLGQYLPLGETSCISCPAGQYSVGTGWRQTVWYANYTDMLPFSSYCVKGSDNSRIPNCGWRPSPDRAFLRTDRISDSQSVVLELRLYLIMNGHITFQYFVIAEQGYDGLTFSINGINAINLTSNTGFARRTFFQNLTSGIYTFRWVYSKDDSVSFGLDSAFLANVEVSGIEEEDDYCELCPPGTYQNNTKSSDCISCPLNTYSNVSGLAQCVACDSSTYSMIASTNCTARLDCTVNDYHAIYSTCKNGFEEVSYDWKVPMICNSASLGSVALPAKWNRTCATCPGGMVRNNVTYLCDPCLDGFYSSGGAACQPCRAGTEATKGYFYNDFEYLPSFTTTTCVGNCATTGFIVNNMANGTNELSSGTGHDAVTVSITFNFVADRPALRFNLSYSMLCGDSTACSASLTDDLGQIFRFYASGSRRVDVVSWTRNQTQTQQVQLKISFQKTPTSLSLSTDRFIIHGFAIEGVRDGGAQRCVACVNGSVSLGSVSTCSPCTSGYTSNSNQTICSICPANTFSERDGGPCYPCGEGTYAVPGSAKCSTNCSFVINGTTWDLSPLVANDFYTPVADKGNKYFINVCSTKHNASICLDGNRNPMDTSACQVTGNGDSYDIGHVLAMRATSNANNLDIQYTMGTASTGCGATGSRRSFVHFVCDPNAGTGLPTAYYTNNTSTSQVESPTCQYHFSWKSAIACPICSSDHYDSYVTECLNGQNVRRYFWKQPKMCRSGVSLPSDAVQSCTILSITCPPGTYYNALSASCVGCNLNSYSVGGGYDYSDWQSISPFVSASCDDGSCATWATDKSTKFIRSPRASTSTLTLRESFVRDGNLTFAYSVFAIGANFTFWFTVDGVTKFSTSKLTLSKQTFSLSIVKGSHVFEWHTRASVTASLPSFASIYQIVESGSSTAAYSCLPCAAGSYTLGVNSTGCTLCPIGTYSIGSEGTCLACPDGQTSLVGSKTCIPKRQCSLTDYVPVRGPCFNGIQNTSYVRLEPAYCDVTPAFSALIVNQSLPCESCSAATSRDDLTGTCKGCNAGTSGMPCYPIAAGYKGLLFHKYFHESTSASWPPRYETGCVGMCGTNGWRVLGNAIDSGVHVDTTGPVTTYVSYYANLTENGLLQFDMQFPDIQEAGATFELFVDTTLYILTDDSPGDWEYFALPIEKGQHTFVWVYAQPPGAVRTAVELRNIIVSGVAPGPLVVGTMATACPAGTYNAVGGQASCLPCNIGSYANETGTAFCAPCAGNTSALNSGSTQCLSCGPWSSSDPSNGISRCNSSCKFNYTDMTTATNISFDLGYFKMAKNKVLGPYVVDTHRRLNISLCGNDLDCVGADGNKFASSVCLYDTTKGYHTDFGSVLDFSPFPGELMNMGMRLSFSSGSECSPGRARQTFVDFKCESIHYATPVIEVGDCDITIEYYTSYACPVCNSTQYEQISDQCSGTNYNVWKQKKGGETCNDPIGRTLVGTYFCIQNITDDTTSLGAVFAITLLVVCFLFIFCVICIVKNRKLNEKFVQLQNQFSSQKQQYDRFEMESKEAIPLDEEK